jgi:hypothetical protein
MDVSGLNDEQVTALIVKLSTGGGEAEDVDTALALIRARNTACIECAAPPEWASLNTGAVVCLACSGVHRSLGVHLSKVRSLLLDSWEAGNAAVLLATGNAASAVAYAGASTPLRPDAGRGEREAAIRCKYERVEEGGGEEAQRALLEATRAGDMPAMLGCLARGALQLPLLAHPPGAPTTALHAACLCPLPLAAVSLLMSTSGWDGGVEDGEGHTPFEELLRAAVEGRVASPPNALLTALAAVLLPRRARAEALSGGEAVLSCLREGEGGAQAARTALVAMREARLEAARAPMVEAAMPVAQVKAAGAPAITPASPTRAKRVAPVFDSGLSSNPFAPFGGSAHRKEQYEAVGDGSEDEEGQESLLG